MSEGTNAGVHVLEEFVCDAIPEPAASRPAKKRGTRGRSNQAKGKRGPSAGSRKHKRRRGS